MEEDNPPKKSATDEEIEQLVAETLLINAIKRRQMVYIEMCEPLGRSIEPDQHPGIERASTIECLSPLTTNSVEQ